MLCVQKWCCRYFRRHELLSKAFTVSCKLCKQCSAKMGFWCRMCGGICGVRKSGPFYFVLLRLKGTASPDYWLQWGLIVFTFKLTLARVSKTTNHVRIQTPIKSFFACCRCNIYQTKQYINLGNTIVQSDEQANIRQYSPPVSLEQKGKEPCSRAYW